MVEIKVYNKKSLPIPHHYLVKHKRIGGFKEPKKQKMYRASIPTGEIFIYDENLAPKNRKIIEKVWGRVRLLFKDLKLTELTVNLGVVKLKFKK